MEKTNGEKENQRIDLKRILLEEENNNLYLN